MRAMKALSDLALVESYIPMAKFIAAVCGPDCEVALYWLGDLNHSTVFIANNGVSGQKIGDPAIASVLELARQKAATEADFAANLSLRADPEGTLFRLSLFFIRNTGGNIVGLLSANIDTSMAQQLRRFAETLIAPYAPVPEPAQPEALVLSAPDVVDAALRVAMQDRGCTSAAELSREDKISIIAALNEQKVFLVKGTVPLVAHRLKISTPSIYRYLKDLKRA